MKKRFWKDVDVVPQDNGWVIHLDGRPLRLPGRTLLHVSAQPLAEALAAEWRQAGKGPGELFHVDELPLTGLCGTMTERVPAEREGMTEALLAYAHSDLLCYRADNWSELSRLQEEQWGRWLSWCARTFGASLQVTEGIMPITQPSEAVKALRDALEGMTPAELTVLAVAVPVLGSLVLGLAALKSDEDAEALVKCAMLDEQSQMERWGADIAITDCMAAKVRDVADVLRFRSLLCQK
ncbi:ATP12 family chaperone protein [Acetobacter thailandicus]|uniref:ATP12 family chaperone protein n=1 Tax=Acetobacter thailandicus TaxID=1502842 RepID=UPI001BA67126|nr:ATP12 family protein [Acetobacter thailandicus]MBS0980537.1 hypothetical protein [Acetobacter thailandicus]